MDQDPPTMTAMRRGLVTLLLLSALAGCGGSDDKKSGSDEPEVSEPATSASEQSPSASEQSPSITVSAKTTCDQLFGGDGKGPLEVVVDWWSTDEGLTSKLSDALEEVEQIAATAGPELQPYLLTAVSETKSAAASGGDATTFKAAGLEVSNACVDLY